MSPPIDAQGRPPKRIDPFMDLINSVPSGKVWEKDQVEGEVRKIYHPEDPFLKKRVDLATDTVWGYYRSYHDYDFRLSNPSTYSLKLQFGLGKRSFGNNAGLDHSGFNGKFAIGLRFSLGSLRDHNLFLRGFYESQGLNKHLSDSMTSEVRASTFGGELNYLWEVYPNWLYLGPQLSLGRVRYRSPQEEGRGVQFNETPELRPVNASGVHLGLGGQVCTWGMRLCVGMDYTLDKGLAQGLESVQPSGWKAFAGIDVFRFFDKKGPRTVQVKQNGRAEKLRSEIHETMKNTQSDQLVYDYVRTLPEKTFDFRVSPSSFQSHRFPNEAAALKKILENAPRIFAIGEFHWQSGYLGKSATDLFVNGLLPVLQKDYRHLVFEFLPADLPSSELEWFMKNGKVAPQQTPLLSAWLKLFPNEGKAILTILHACRKYGIEVHPSGYTQTLYFQLIRDSVSYRKRRDALVPEITKNSLRALKIIAGGKKRVMFYGGKAHNDIDIDLLTNFDLETTSFGDDLVKEFSYVELDIEIPHQGTHFFRKFRGWNTLGSMRLYTPYVPPQGKVSLVQRGSHSYSLVYPFDPLGRGRSIQAPRPDRKGSSKKLQKIPTQVDSPPKYSAKVTAGNRGSFQNINVSNTNGIYTIAISASCRSDNEAKALTRGVIKKNCQQHWVEISRNPQANRCVNNQFHSKLTGYCKD